uniref:C2H2-type domain-containing protein n=1 Tax=Sphenodon punctatus TaxID=8508 RepID=A0A8D0G6M8_SPHPU
MNARSCNMSHRTASTPHRPGMINGQQQIPPIRVHAGTPCPSSNGSTPSPALGNLSTNLHLKMPLGGGVAPQSNITDSTVHLPALSPRRQVVTNGKTLFQVPQPPGLPAPQSLKPKQQEFGNLFPTNTGKGGLGYGPRCKSIGKGSCNNLVVTSSPMMVQRLGPISPPANQVSTACNQISPSLQRALNAANLNIPPSDTRSLMSRESLASTTLSLSESQSTLSVKQEWSHGYRILPSLPSNQGSQNTSELGDILSIPPGTSMSSNSISNSLPSYLFGVENNHSPYPSPHHSSTRSHSARSKKRALSLSPLSDGIGIDFNTIIRTSPTSLVAYINGSRASPANISPQPEVYGHFLGVRGSCIPQPCSIPNAQKSLGVANGNITLPAYSENGIVEYHRMQQLEQSSLQSDVMNNMVVQQTMPLADRQPLGLLKSEHVDDFSGRTIGMPPSLPPTMPPPPPPQGPPPPYHAHRHRHQHDLINHSHQLSLPSSAQGSLLDEDGELDDFNGKHCCRWIDCSAMYDQQEELVRHIEKVHIDQRKGEDFTCFWSGCPRRYKSFNARYKLLIHMRVHSGEKPNKCTVSLNYGQKLFCVVKASQLKGHGAISVMQGLEAQHAEPWTGPSFRHAGFHHAGESWRGWGCAAQCTAARCHPSCSPGRPPSARQVGAAANATAAPDPVPRSGPRSVMGQGNRHYFWPITDRGQTNHSSGDGAGTILRTVSFDPRQRFTVVNI